MMPHELDYAVPVRKRAPAWRVMLYGAIVGVSGVACVAMFEMCSSYGSALPGCIVAGPLVFGVVSFDGPTGAILYCAGVPVMYAIYALSLRTNRRVALAVLLFHLFGCFWAYRMLH